MKHKTQTKRLLSLVLALCMVISMFSGLTLMASAADETWTPVELASVQPTDVIVIVATKADGSTFAMPNDKGTQSAPTATAITVTDGTLTSVADNLKWNVTKDGTNYKFNPAGDASTYLYCTNTNNGVRVGTNTGNQFALDASGYLENVATSRYIGVYATQDWRCYTSPTATNIKGQTFTFYKLGGGDPAPDTYAITTEMAGQNAVIEDISIPASAAANEDVTITSTSKKIVDVLVKTVSGTTIETVPVDDHNVMFTMPAEAVNVIVQLEDYYDVVLNVTGGTDADVVVDPATAPVGATVTVSATASKIIESVTCNPVCGVIEVGGAYCFEMPAGNVLVSVTLKTAPVFAIDTKTSVGEGGVVVAEPAEATEGAQVTLTAKVDDGYELATWGYSYLGTEDVVTVELPTDSLTATFTMPGEDVDVYATFKEKVVVYHDVLLYGYQHESSLTVEDGLTLEGRLPELTAPEGYSFVGWTEAVEDNADGSCPTMYNETTPVTGDLMLNAVYSKAGEGGGSGDYVKVTAEPTSWEGQYVIVYEVSATEGYVFDASGTDEAGIDKANNYAETGINNNTILAAVGDDYFVTIETIAGGYTILTKSGLYIGVTSDSNDILAKPDQKYVNTIELTTEKVCTIKSAGAYLRYNKTSNQMRFRYYKSGSYTQQQPIHLYKKESGSLTYTLNPVAGVVEAFTKDPTVILNYDRNVKLELDMLVDTAKLGGHTVKDIQTDLMDMNAGWYNSEEVGKGTIVTSNKDGILIENPDPNLSLVGNFQVTLDDNSTGTGIITIMGAQKVYCEDDNNMFDFTDGKKGTWDIDFSGDEVQFQDVKDRFDDRDSHYVNCATYSGNFAHVATVGATEVKPSAANTWPTATFTFRGTGFELISAANAFGGAGKIELKNAGGELISAYIFNNYYGGKYNGETGKWEKTGGGNNAVNQAPIAAAEKLPYGDYQVTVTAIYSPAFDYAELGEYQLVIDGARVIDPLDEAGEGSCAYEEYKIHDLISEASETEGLDKINLYIDGRGEISVLDALQFGPANEIYLAPGQAIPMQFIAAEIPTISIGARAYTGAPTTLGVYKATDGAITAPFLTEQIATATDMHYALGNIFTLNETAGYFETGTIVVRNDGAEPLALTSVRYESGYDVGAWVDNESYAAAAKFVKIMAQNKQNFASLTDVDANAWYFGSVKFAVESGIMAGVGDNRFAPKQELTRAMAVRVLYVLAGQPEAKANTTFTDVAANTWYADAVAWGAENGIVAGVSATKFNPNGKLTREQMVAFLYRYAGKAQVADDSIANYTDGAQVSAYAVNAMNWAIANGIVSGMGNGTLAPKATANRAQMASILAHCDELYAN